MKFSKTMGRLNTRQSSTSPADSKLRLLRTESPVTGLAQERRAIFLDRDGVINTLRPNHVTAWSEFQFLPGALEAIRELSLLGWPIVVATNQSAVARGLLSPHGLSEIHRRMVTRVENAGGRIDLIVHCPHLPEDECVCRKPRAGLFQEAAERLNVDLTESYFVGDSLTDLDAARTVGMTFVLVRSGLGAKSLAQQPVLATQADSLADTIAEAAQWILEREDAVVEMRPERQAA